MIRHIVFFFAFSSPFRQGHIRCNRNLSESTRASEVTLFVIVPRCQPNSAYTAAVLQAGRVYRIVMTDIFGCTDNANVSVFILDLPFVNAGSDQKIAFGSPAILTASGNSVFAWIGVSGWSFLTVGASWSTVLPGWIKVGTVAKRGLLRQVRMRGGGVY